MSDAVQMRVTNHENFGRLVMTWATGKNYLKDGKDYPRPQDLATLVKQCDDAGVGLTLPENVKGLVVYTYDENTLVLRLPPAKVVEEANAAIRAGQSYPLPAFYGAVPKLNTAEAREAFQAARIGDYTISHCQ